MRQSAKKPRSLTLMFLRLLRCTFTFRGSNMPLRQIESNLYLSSSSLSQTLLTFSGFSPSGMYSLNLQTNLPNFLPLRTLPVSAYTCYFYFLICLVLIFYTIISSFSYISFLIFFKLCICCRNSFSSALARAYSWAALFFLFLWRISTTGSSDGALVLTTQGSTCQQSITLSFSFSISLSLGLQEWPDSGTMMAGISVGLYLCLRVSGAAHGSSSPSRANCLTGRLSYLGFGRGCGLFLNLLGSRGCLCLRLSSWTSSCGLNFSLIYSSLARARAQSSSETSMFLAHFFLFCLPFSPFILTSSLISTLMQLYQSITDQALKVISTHRLTPLLQKQSGQ